MGLNGIFLWAAWIIGAFLIISMVISAVVVISISMKSSRFSQSTSSSEETLELSMTETEEPIDEDTDLKSHPTTRSKIGPYQSRKAAGHPQ